MQESSHSGPSGDSSRKDPPVLPQGKGLDAITNSGYKRNSIPFSDMEVPAEMEKNRFIKGKTSEVTA